MNPNLSRPHSRQSSEFEAVPNRGLFFTQSTSLNATLQVRIHKLFLVRSFVNEST